MSFLAPLFLLGAAAVTLPVLFHLIRRTTREKTVFSSLLFLAPTPPRLTRKSKLEHLLLLALRCLVLVLLALGFSRPFFTRPVIPERPGGSRRMALLLDTSASMRRPNLWEQAKHKAESVLGKAEASDQVALYTFDRDLKQLMGFEEWNSAPAGERSARAMQKLSGISPGWSETHLGTALTSAAERLHESGQNQAMGPTELVVITDLQQGSQQESLQGYAWPKDLEVDFQVVKPQNTGNASLQLLTDANDVLNPNGALRVRVSNSADSKREQFKVGWAANGQPGFMGIGENVYVPAGQGRILTLKRPQGSTNTSAHLVLEGDAEDFDNNLYLANPTAAQVQVVYLGNDSATGAKKPLFFLQRAFQQNGAQLVRIIAHASDGAVAAEELQNANLFVVAGALPSGTAGTLSEQIQSGKTAFVSLQSVNDSAGLARLLGLEQVHLEEVQPENYAMLGEIDFRHPLFMPFAEPKFSDFTKIHFWKYRKVALESLPNAKAVAKFDSGDPALLDIPVGKGRVLLLTCGWQPEESQLALSSKFVPFLYSLLEESGVPSQVPAQYKVGDVVSLKASHNGAMTTVLLPDGSQRSLPEAITNFSDTLMPGVYTVTSETPPRTFAVNLAPSESRTAALPVEELEHLGVPLSRREQPRQVELARKTVLQNAELESRQKIWRWLLAATLGLVIVETWLAGAAARKLRLWQSGARMETTRTEIPAGRAPNRNMGLAIE